jgi:hypothetical protein
MFLIIMSVCRHSSDLTLTRLLNITSPPPMTHPHTPLPTAMSGAPTHTASGYGGGVGWGGGGGEQCGCREGGMRGRGVP